MPSIWKNKKKTSMAYDLNDKICIHFGTKMRGISLVYFKYLPKSAKVNSLRIRLCTVSVPTYTYSYTCNVYCIDGNGTRFDSSSRESYKKCLVATKRRTKSVLVLCHTSAGARQAQNWYVWNRWIYGARRTTQHHPIALFEFPSSVVRDGMVNNALSILLPQLHKEWFACTQCALRRVSSYPFNNNIHTLCETALCGSCEWTRARRRIRTFIHAHAFIFHSRCWKRARTATLKC